VRRFLVGAYWGGLAAALVVLAVVALRPRILPDAMVQELAQLVPALLVAGVALLTSVLAAGTMLLLREIGEMRVAVERANSRAAMPTRLRSWAADVAGGKATVPCGACGRTNWAEAHVCVDCGAPMVAGGTAAAH
jgi:hypothetical protein